MWYCSGKEERLGDAEGSAFDSGLRFSFFLIGTLSITGQRFSKWKIATATIEKTSRIK